MRSFALCAALLAALPAAAETPATTQVGSWLEMQAGPQLLHAGRPGLTTGPEVRLSAGTSLGDRAAAELWISGALQSAPRSTPGDMAQAAGGVGGRLQLYRFDPESRLALWGHAGLGLAAATSGDAPHGLLGFAGAQLLFQPIVKRFAFGLEADAVGGRQSLGLAVLPSLRCAL